MTLDAGVLNSRKSLTEAGYRGGSPGKCRACDAQMEWWTTPKGASMPMHVVIGKPQPPKTGSLFE